MLHPASVRLQQLVAAVENLVSDSHSAGQPGTRQYYIGVKQNPTGAVEFPTPAARGMPRAAGQQQQVATLEKQEMGAAQIRTDGAMAAGGSTGTCSPEVGGDWGPGLLNHSNPGGEAREVEGNQTGGLTPSLRSAGGWWITETGPTAGFLQSDTWTIGPVDCYFVMGHILGHVVQCLSDSESMVTLLSKKVYDGLPSDSSLELQASACIVTGVNGVPVHTYDRLQLPIVVVTQVSTGRTCGWHWGWSNPWWRPCANMR